MQRYLAPLVVGQLARPLGKQMRRDKLERSSDWRRPRWQILALGPKLKYSYSLVTISFLQPTSHRHVGLLDPFLLHSPHMAMMIWISCMIQILLLFCIQYKSLVISCMIQLCWLPLVQYQSPRATTMTSTSIRGVTIPIYLVISTMDSLCQSAVVLKLYQ